MTTSHAHREENLLEDIQERLDNLNKSEGGQCQRTSCKPILSEFFSDGLPGLQDPISTEHCDRNTLCRPEYRARRHRG